MMGEISERYFNDLFICCDEEKINKISVPKATELFRSASLSNEIIQEVSYKIINLILFLLPKMNSSVNLEKNIFGI
jgi:hypothetical protein